MSAICGAGVGGGGSRNVKKLFARLDQQERERARAYDPDAYPLPTYLSGGGGTYGLLLRKAWDTFYPDRVDGARTPCVVLRSVADWPAASERDLLHIPLLQVRQGSASSPPPNDDAFAQSTSPSTTRVTLAYGEATCDTLQEWLRAVLRIMAYTCACSTDEAADYLAELERIFRASPEDVARRVVPFSFEEWECVWSAAALDPSLDLGERQRFAWRPVADELFESSWREAELMIRLTPLEKAALDARIGGA